MPDAQDGYIRSLQAEVATLRQSVVDQAAELGKAHAALEGSQPLHLTHAAHNLPIGKLRDIRQEDEATQGWAKKGVMRDFIICRSRGVIPLILLYPWISVYLAAGRSIHNRNGDGWLSERGDGAARPRPPGL